MTSPREEGYADYWLEARRRKDKDSEQAEYDAGYNEAMAEDAASDDDDWYDDDWYDDDDDYDDDSLSAVHIYIFEGVPL